MFRRKKDDITVGEAVALARVPFGWPGACPDCGREGYLVRIDVATRTSRSECRPCGAEWQMVEAPDGTALPVT